MFYTRSQPNPTIKNISVSHDAIRMLRTIQRFGFHSAIIAGGAIRDMYSNRTVKDYDIFLWDPDAEGNPEKGNFPTPVDGYNESVNKYFIAKMCMIPFAEVDSFFGTTIIEQHDPEGDGAYLASKFVSQIWDVEYLTNTYQLVFLKKDPMEYFDANFDFGICKAYCDGRKLHFSGEFLNDIRNETITLRDCGISEAHFNYILETHLQRVKKKFPSHKVIIHPALQKYISDDNKHLI